MEKELEFERDLRQQKEKELAKSFADENYKIVRKIEDEKVERDAKIKELSKEVKIEFKEQKKTLEETSSLIVQQLEQYGQNFPSNIESD